MAMTPVEALRLAMSKEQDAIKLYRSMAMQHPAIKELFLSLVQEEEKHERMLKQRLSELTMR